MLMQKNTVKTVTATFILITLGILAISVMPTPRVSAEPELENDMPVVFVDPLVSTAQPGETFTISVKIFNLSNAFILTNVDWQPGDPPPSHDPAALRNNYSLGNLYGLDMGFKWDPTILEYVSHTVTIPVETYSEGVLHEPIIDIKNNVSETETIPGAPAGSLYWLAQSSFYPAEPFNAPGANATVFTMTFRVKRNGVSALEFTNMEISDPVAKIIPHWLKHGQFRTGALATRIETLTVQAEADDTLYSVPVISGENAAIQVTMKNDNLTETDTYDLALFYDESPILDATWENRTLGPGQNETLEYLIQDPEIGPHNVTARATIRHAGNIINDELAVQFSTIDTPTLTIDGPDSASAGQTITFTASGSTHEDPNGQITNYAWTLWRLGETAPLDEQPGETVEFQLPTKITKVGNWTVMLVVQDNYGMTAQAPAGATLSPTSDLRRPATGPYRASFTVDVSQAPPPTLFTVENLVLILILVVIIVAAVFYLRRRSR
jgi:hypothetical protein